MTAAPQAILDLVERFSRNADLYRSPSYNETQARREFIDPFFAALGWDVNNARGVSPRYREVIHEASLRARGSVTAPDYCFRVGTERKFFVEAKKPAVSIQTDIQPAYQLRRYAWTAKLPLSILTDFEEFSVYDCRFRPKPGEQASQARTLCLTYDQYPGRWEEIASIFSRDAVWNGDYDRYAQTTRGKRGTQEVDREFLKEIEGWRVSLARNIALRNPGLGVRELNYAVQKTIDRILFLRICEDRGIEPYEQLRDIANGTESYPRLLDLFRRADERFNSGIFHFREEKGRNERPDSLTPTLLVDDKVLRGIIGKLYYPDSPYEFSVLSVEILGNVYEQFLGSVIRLTPAHRAVVEQKPKVRKAGGVYYTPEYIVDYIVEHTVGELCKGKTPGEVARLRILDPACGSGSFLLGAYEYLLNYHLDWYAEHPTKRGRQEIYEGSGGDWFLTTEEKKRILLNNIYGVDIDPQAVEVTKLSLLLKVLEAETRDSLGQQLELIRERALPDLASNIKCGNSLIGPDFYDGEQMSLLDAEEMYRINPFDWEVGFRAIMRDGGFDAVIGNPPWGAAFSISEQEYFRMSYDVARARTIDSYALFIQGGLRRLRVGGLLGFITPDTFLRKDDRLPLRKHLLEETTIVQLLETGPLFSKVRDTWCLIFTVRKGPPGPDSQVGHKKISRFVVSAEERLARFGMRDWDVESAVPQSAWRNGQGLIIGYKASQAEQSVIARMERSPRLKDMGDRYAVSRGEEGSKFALREKPDGDFFMVIPQDVKRYQVAAGMAIEGRSLTAAKVKRFYTHPKLWITRIQKLRWRQRLVCGLDDRSRSAGMKTLQLVISTDDDISELQFLQGVLASSLVNFWCVNYLADDMNKSYLQKIPIPVLNREDAGDPAGYDRMVALVERMLALHKQVAEAKTPTAKELLQRQIDATDRQIDRLVYELYGLTEEEIGIVEESQLSR